MGDTAMINYPIFGIDESDIETLARELLQEHVPEHELHDVIAQVAESDDWKERLNERATEIINDELRQYLPKEQRQ